MKLCLVMGGNEEGGMENHVIEIANAFSDKKNGKGDKYQVHLIAHEKYALRLNNAVHFHPLDMTMSRRNPVLLFKLTQLIRDISPEIIHAQANKAVSLIASIKPFLPKHIKRVATQHSLKRNVRAYEKYDWVIGVSHRVLESLKNPNKSVIYNGVSLDKTRIQAHDYLLKEFSKSFGINQNDKLVVAIGRLVEVKRFDILIKAFKDIQDAHLLIIGEGENKQILQDLITQQTKESDLKNTHLLAEYRRDNIEIVSAADLCVISSEREGFSYVMAESLLVETPVISTNVADMKRILPNRSVVAVNDMEALKQVLNQAIEDYDEFRNAYPPVFSWASKKLSFNEMLDGLDKVYLKMVY